MDAFEIWMNVLLTILVGMLVFAITCVGVAIL